MKNATIFNGLNKIFLVLFVVLPIITACSKDDEPEVNVEVYDALVSKKYFNQCLEQVEKKYAENWLVACENKIKDSKQKLITCENIYLPWRKQGISRDQYCRNAMVLTTDYDKSYRSCMEALDPNLSFSISNCIGDDVADNIRDCNLSGIALRELEEEKQASIDECSGIYNK